MRFILLFGAQNKFGLFSWTATLPLFILGVCLDLCTSIPITCYDFECRHTENGSYNDIQDCTIEPTPPFASYLGAYNITLGWSPLNISGVKYIIQWKYVHIASEWEYTEIVTEPSYTVNNLSPYTEYWFRVIWIICQLQFQSLPSLVYRTLAFGVPSVAPIIENLEGSSLYSIEVSWLPPMFPNGPIVGYNLKLSTDQENPQYSSVTGKLSFQFYATKPGTTYRISIAAVNVQGEGPAAEASITMMNATVSDKPLWLFLSRNNTFKKRENLPEMIYEAQCLTVHNRITGISMDIYNQKVYFSEDYEIWVKGANDMSDMTDFRILYAGSGNITSISVDWLNNNIYFIMDNQLYFCDLKNCTSAEHIPLTIVLPPLKIVVDPYNGYLFLLLNNGIHRTVLPESPNQAIVTHIINSSIIQDFMVNVQLKRVVYASVHRGNISIVSAFLDGTNDKLLRHIKDSDITEIRSFFYFNDHLFFTDGNQVFQEYFYSDRYWYNEYLVTCDLAASASSDYNNIMLYGESIQPFPLPTQPQNVMVLFGAQFATIIWQPPRSTIESSPTAWRDWMYSINVTSEDSKASQMFSNISYTNITVTKMAPSTKYSVTVHASSPAGNSQWTVPVTGTTLDPSEEEPFFIAVGHEGTWRQPLDLFGPGELLYRNLRFITDLDWYNNTLFWSNETGHVHMWNMNDTFSPIYIKEIRRAGPISFDWLGLCIYWSDRISAKIYRKPLSSPDIEVIRSVSYLVNDMAVDSTNGFLYWSTDYTVESSKLNGQKHSVIQNLTLFTSRQVVALAMDFKHCLLYWLVKDGLNINLYHSKLRDDGIPDAPITEFAFWSSSEIWQNALMFHSDRLFWINGQKYITVQEVNQRICTAFSQPAEFTAFTLVLNSIKPLPGNFSYTPKVIPDLVPSSSFKIQGNYSHFLVVWKGTLNVEYGVVFYCVESKVLQHMSGLDRDPCLSPEGYSNPFFVVQGLKPYIEFDFSVTPYTYWRKGPTTTLTLRAPEGVPSVPLNPRIFRLQDKESMGVEMRWDYPEAPNGVLTHFTVCYRIINESKNAMRSILNATVSTTSFYLYDLKPEILLQFQVKAHTSIGPGPFSETAEANISDVRPAPAIINISSKEITLVDTDRMEAMWNFTVEEPLKSLSYTAHNGKLYYILNDLLFSRDIGNLSNVLLLKDEKLLRSHSMTVDWIARHIYVNIHSEKNVSQLFVIDLEQKNKVLKTVSTFLIPENSSIEAIAAYPLQSRLYLMESWDKGKRISYYNIQDSSETPVLGSENKTSSVKTGNCNCSVEPSELGTSLALDITDKANPGIYYVSNVTDIWSSDLEGCRCLKVITVPMLSGATITSLAVDDYFIYWSVTNQKNTTIYYASKYAKHPVILGMTQEMTIVMAYSISLQPFPEKECLVLVSDGTQPRLLSAANTSLTLELPPAVTQSNCSWIITPTPTYKVTFRKHINDSGVRYYSAHKSDDITLEFHDQVVVIPGLQPYCSYEFGVIVTNYYSFLLDQPPSETAIIAKTAYGVPGAVTTMLTSVLSDTSVNIQWSSPSQPNGPLSSIRYQIASNILPLTPISPWRQSEFPNGQLAWSFTGLHGGTSYLFKVLAFHPEENWFNESPPTYITTFKAPATPSNIVPGNTTLELQWTTSEEDIMNFYFEIKELIGQDWRRPMNMSCIGRPLYTCILTGVTPNTYYHVRAIVIYVTGAKGTSKPADFKTSAGIPGKAGTPYCLPGDQNTIHWNTAEDNGGNLTYNILEYRKVLDNKKGALTLWHVAYNGSCIDICIWKATTMEGTFQFRAAAANVLGLGDYSDVSESILLTKEKSDSVNEVTIIVATISAILLGVLVTAAFAIYKRVKYKHNTTKENPTVIFEDKELAELRGLSNAVGFGKACYAISILPTQTDMQSLAQFPREKLTLCLFLGSGAFGEVYEGTAADILGPETGTTRVAVKTLKSDATDHEKSEFLKEAHLMSQFDHPNILKLLGVCLFNEPQYIILELMDGGDLLSYLRDARANTFLQKPLLSTLDLLDIALNICNGGAYLEKMHFVHRDLAARNCLVSVKGYNSPDRIVKIGDFGLARDIYSNDYYKKKGEGFLPVRWMAPESLIDGIFTSRSDVWSYGIVLWEVFSFGQQPYPGYSNLEVLHHVRSGQRMEAPVNCSDDLWDLILKCWAQHPKERPSFSYLRKQLEELKLCSLRWTQRNVKRMSLEGVFNPAFEDTEVNISSREPEGSGPLTLTETRNPEGLNYLMITT
ncbi:proto-oncogene tyrosine-protein kinase ROS [Spea bombifrons]|uniref:proto-oncogene tyrosine-protein kinase ROS n=1 Tax=Spea bombifrons TaxID=233779 RepID=UPI00234A7DCD|nr:proto-oncogene tyrosine-protein kinase ROS [Spea bombifrons]